MELDENIKGTMDKTFITNSNIIKNLINLINENNLQFDNSFPNTIKNNYKDLYFLNKKIMPLNSLEIINKKIDVLKKNENICNTKTNKIFKIKKIRKNLYQIDKCNNIYINKSLVKKNQINNSDLNQDNNNQINNKYKSAKEKNIDKDINLKDSLSIQFNVKKNNKLVFMNKGLIKQKKKSTDIIEKKGRKSLYRGVSKNGNNWQVIISNKNNNAYIGTYPSQEIAAVIYDIISIKNKGIKAKTNFIYNINQILKISESNFDFKSQSINEILSYIFKE